MIDHEICDAIVELREAKSAPKTATDRIEAWLARREAHGWFEGWEALARLDRAQQWRDIAARYGVESGGARGSMLELVRLAWDDDRVHVMPTYDGRWAVFGTSSKPHRGDISADTEIDALVAALEFHLVRRNTGKTETT